MVLFIASNIRLINIAMSKYASWNPDWFYTRVNVEPLRQIQSEFEIIRKEHWHKFCDHDVNENDADWWDFSAMPRSIISHTLQH